MSKYNYGHRSKHNWDEEEDCGFDDEDRESVRTNLTFSIRHI